MDPVNPGATDTSAKRNPSLRDHLLASLSSLPTSQRLELTVLYSVPKRTHSLFPHTANPPRCFEKEYLVVLSAEEGHTPAVKAGPSSVNGPANGPASALTKRETDGVDDQTTGFMSGQSPGVSLSGGEDTSEITASALTGSPTVSAATTATANTSTVAITTRPILIVAFQAYLYTLPSSSLSILYISKVDTSGYSTSPLSLTKELMTSFIAYHLDSGRIGKRVQVALFARSQGQYLFPNSIQGGGKRVGGGLKLCGWWKGVYEEVVRRVKAEGGIAASDITLSYLLPSYSGDEALGMLGQPRTPLPEGTRWNYAPPFQNNLFQTASNDKSGESSAQLAWCIPALPDDPKTRFMDELVIDQMGQMGRGQSRKKQELRGEQEKGLSWAESNIDTNSGEREDTQASEGEEEEEDSISIPSGNPEDAGLTAPATNSSEKRSVVKRNKNKERQEEERLKAQTALNCVSPEEFWERMGFRQECASGDVTGFFHLDLDTSSAFASASDSVPGANEPIASSATPHADPPKDSFALRPAIVDRIHKSLLNCDFANIHYAVEGTAIWQRSSRAIITGELGEEGWKACTGIIEGKMGIEAVGEKRKEEVTMLQPRKKQKAGGEGAVNTLQPRKKETVNVLQPRKK